MPRGLPHGLPDGLHILEPSSGVGWYWWLLTFLILWWLWKRWLRQRRRQEPEPAAVDGGVAGPSPPVLGGAIEDLRRRHLSSGDFRGGCHELAKTIRGHLEDLRGKPEPEALTARELAGQFQEPIARLVLRVADLRWRRREPTRNEFESACTLASDVLRVTEGKRQ